MKSSSRRSQRGQSIVEYLVVAAAVIGALVAFNASIAGGIARVGNDAAVAMGTGGDRVAGINPIAQ